MNYYISTVEEEVTVIKVVGNLVRSFPQAPDNSDYIAYQEWLAEGNTPEPWPPAE